MMSNAVRQRQRNVVHNNNDNNKPTTAATASHLDVALGSAASSSSNDGHEKHNTNTNTNNSSNKAPTSSLTFLARVLVRRKWLLPFLVVTTYIVGPTATYIPQALWIWASHGFATEFLLGAGLSGLVGSMVTNPHQLMIGDVTPPTPLAAYRDVLLDEYEHYRTTHTIPILAHLDPDEQGPLDVLGEWQTLFLKTMGRPTCAASHFPRTMEAVRNSGLVAYSIMFSRLAPGQIIQPHTGFSKMIQIYHLALVVPIQESPIPDANNVPLRPFITVESDECSQTPTTTSGGDDGGDSNKEESVEVQKDNNNNNNNKDCRRQTYEWTQGKEFIFDDSFTHSAENPTDSERLVFFLHIKRVDFKGWRDEWIAGSLCYLFSWVPFPSVLKIVKGTEATCALASPLDALDNLPPPAKVL